MVGRNPGYVTTQGQVLSELFSDAGYPVVAASGLLNRYARLADIVHTLIRQRNKIDILVLDVYGEQSFVVEDIASQLGRWCGMRVIMLLHNGTFPEFMVRFPRWTRRVLSRANALVTPSDFLSRAVAACGFQAQVIPNVIDLASYPYRHRRHLAPRLFWMRSFFPYYNPAMAVRVLARLKQRLPEATLLMAGQDKGIQGEVRQLAEALGVSDAVRFPGFLDASGKAREAEAVDIFLNTNNVDNTPVSVIEACAMGLPVIATNVGGIRDLLSDGETALLVPDDDDRAMAEAVNRLLEDPDLAGRLSVNGRKLAERSAWKQVRPQWERVFAQVAAEPGCDQATKTEVDFAKQANARLR
jgi:glycosyltransferase involved in cell wall biosynthesis